MFNQAQQEADAIKVLGVTIISSSLFIFNVLIHNSKATVPLNTATA